MKLNFASYPTSPMILRHRIFFILAGVALGTGLFALQSFLPLAAGAVLGGVGGFFVPKMFTA